MTNRVGLSGILANFTRIVMLTAFVGTLSADAQEMFLPDPPVSRREAYDTSNIPNWLKGRFPDRIASRRDNPEMMELVDPVAEMVAGGVVAVRCGGRTVALGTVVSSTLVGPKTSNAFVITKRSELTGDPITVQLGDGPKLPARVAAVRSRSDLALLVIQSDASQAVANLRPVRFSSVVPSVGSFVVSSDETDRGDRAFGLGVVGTGARSVTHQGGLGVHLGQDDLGTRVLMILPDSGADRAGLEKGDRIVAIDGRRQTDKGTVISTLHSMFPGEVVRLTIERDGESVDISAKLSELSVMQESENDARVNGARNARLSGFERVLQHDTVLKPDQCGGPLLDLDGRVVGINIARAGRVVSYALPSSLVEVEVNGMITEANSH